MKNELRVGMKGFLGLWVVVFGMFFLGAVAAYVVAMVNDYLFDRFGGNVFIADVVAVLIVGSFIAARNLYRKGAK